MNDSPCPVVLDCKNNDVATDGYIYSVINGIRYGLKDGVAKVVGQPTSISGSITIPTSVTYKGTTYSVTTIGEVKYCRSLTSITIPNSVTIINSNAFYNCTGLTSITIPNGVTSIGGRAFDGCGSLTSITFQGTKAEWYAIPKGQNWNLNTGNYVIHCTDGNISESY